MNTVKPNWQITKSIDKFRFNYRSYILLIVSFICFTANAAFQDTQDELKPLSTDDYGKWESIGFGGTISNDGNTVAYPINRNNDNNELRLYSVKDKSTRILENGSNPKFSNNNKWLGYLINPPVSERKKLQKSKKTIYKSFGLINTLSGDSLIINKVSSFQFSDDGNYVTLKRYKAKGSKSKGNDIIIRNLSSGKHFSFGNVIEYSWQDEGSMMAFIVETEDKLGNGIQLFNGKTKTTSLLDSKEAFYKGLTWRDESGDLAVYRSVHNEKYNDSTNIILVWKDLTKTSTDSKIFDQSEFANFGNEKRIVSTNPIRWSKNGNSIFFETNSWLKKPVKRKAKDSTEVKSKKVKATNSHLFEDPPALEIWHSNDVRIVPEQKQRAQRKRELTHLAVWHLEDNKFIQLGDELTEITRFQDDSPIVLGLDETPYEFDGMFGRNNSDVYAIDIKTGAKKKILEKTNRLYGVSPDGENVIYLKDDHYYVYNFQSNESFNLTSNISASFVNKNDDHPVDQKPPYGFIGWDTSNSSIYVHSKYDIWQLMINGDVSVNLTNGASDRIQNRFTRIDFDKKHIDGEESIYVRRYGEWTKKAGYSEVIPGKKIKSLYWGDSYVSRLSKAKNINTVVYVVESYTDSPDYFINKNGKAKSEQISETNPFQSDYHWGKTELIEYTNAKGKNLQGFLIYPDNYIPGNKYPMITYIYELRSQNMHRYIVPSQRNYYNHRVFTSQGYFVLQPDIVFDAGDPGVSSVKTMEAAVNAVADKGLIDINKVGLVGHSWGGYQSAFAVTNTDIFAAAVAGAGLTNLVSMYGMVAWAFGGAPESNHFEVSQERMMVPPWKDIDGYVRNSPVFNIDKMNTPLLFEVGDNDKNVDWRQGIEMYNAARRADKNMVLLVYAKEGHGLRSDKNRIDYHNRILKWFGHYLKGEEPEDWILDGIPYTEQQRRLKDWGKD